MLVSAGLIAAALAVGGPLAANAANVPSISLNTSTATVDGNILVTADGFQPGETLTFSFDSSEQVTNVANGDGHFAEYLYVPKGVTPGTHAVHVTGTDSAEQTADINIIAWPTVTLSASTVTISQINGTGITATATGFSPGESVQFGYGTENQGSEFGDVVVADDDGAATISVTSQALFGASTTGARSLFITAGNVVGSVRSTVATLDIVADASPSAPAAPAVPVKANASFTG
jgi:hypothetical protein